MKKVKLLSAVMATSLMAAQFAMPVMAAEQGSMSVTVTEKTGLIRVEVPTAIEVSLDQYEQGSKSQVYSEEFTLLNKSPMPVRVDVTSTALLGTSGVTLAATKEAAAASTAENGAIWLAVAAATSKTGSGASIEYKYDDLSTEDDTENPADLSDSNANVTAFATQEDNSIKAFQTFLLQKATGNPSWVYVADSKTLTANPGKAYEVTPTDAKSTYATHTNVGAFNTALDTNYLVEVDTATNALVKVWTADDKIADVSPTSAEAGFQASGTEVYVLPLNTTPVNVNTSVSKVYLYQEVATVATTGGEAAFSYIGKLSNKETWSPAADLTTINIAYKFTGAGETVYTEATKDMVFGLYTAPSEPKFANTTLTAKKGTAAVFNVDLGKGSKGASDIASFTYAGMDLLGGDTPLATYEDGKLTVVADAIDYLFSEGLLSATDAKVTAELTVTFTMIDEDAESPEVTLILKGK